MRAIHKIGYNNIDTRDILTGFNFSGNVKEFVDSMCCAKIIYPKLAYVIGSGR